MHAYAAWCRSLRARHFAWVPVLPGFVLGPVGRTRCGGGGGGARQRAGSVCSSPRGRGPACPAHVRAPGTERREGGPLASQHPGHVSEHGGGRIQCVPSQQFIGLSVVHIV